jgi:ubiquinone/menaquinone biosynthesis C-methylase UbiE
MEQETSKDEIQYSCINCEATLIRDECGYHCDGCGASWPLKHGIPYFLKDNFFWGNLNRTEMNSLLSTIENSYWKDVVETDETVKDRDISEYIFDVNRSSWRHYCSLNKDSKVLDIGGLWGTLGFSLAKECELVVAVDAVIENCRFMDLRSQQDNVGNLQPVCANAIDLPFEDESFDLVILNGVLEWTGVSGQEQDPEKIHKRILTKISRMLKKGGCLYIGIENRFGLEYFMGVKDPHTGMRFITVLPRIFADLVSRKKRGRTYSEITHSYFGLKKLLKECNYESSEFLLPLPNYRTIAYLIPFKSNTAFRYAIFNMMDAQVAQASGRIQLFFKVVKLCLTLRLNFLIKYFAPSFSVIARKGSR